jgi:lipoprotein-anchoring transpeptidase ErfK/SrfK
VPCDADPEAARPRRVHRLIRSSATVAFALLGLALAPAARAAVAPQQETVALLTAHGVRERPKAGDRMVTSIAATRPITAARTVLPVIGVSVDRRGWTWLRVRLPGRTLGATPPPRVGWINASHTVRSATAWHIVADVDARRVNVYQYGRRVRRFTAIVGTRSTPTPRGEYFIEESVRLSPDAPGAPFALATSARSAVLQEFAGGPGQIALHGLRNIGGKLGTAASHGCIRLADRAVTWMAARIGSGVPLSVR